MKHNYLAVGALLTDGIALCHQPQRTLNWRDQTAPPNIEGAWLIY
ncbi:hypothetical protein [Paraburkholderia strydomiana]|nr:hypothetical protein [Paraburkholderia strydomiana]MDR7008967.1 hypothetical protein [Paraburkholderia strydomiana]